MQLEWVQKFALLVSRQVVVNQTALFKAQQHQRVNHKFHRRERIKNEKIPFQGSRKKIFNICIKRILTVSNSDSSVWKKTASADWGQTDESCSDESILIGCGSDTVGEIFQYETRNSLIR